MTPAKPLAKSKEAQRLRKVRQAMELSVRDFAQEIGVAPGAISQWENGVNPVPGPVLKLLGFYEKTLIDKKKN